MGIGQYITFAPVTSALFVINLAMSFYVFSNPNKMEEWLFNVRRILGFGEYYRLLTSAFIHANGVHLLFNMFALISFGPFLEMRLGFVKFIVLYFGSLLTADWFVLMMKKNQPSYRALGASGAISGVVFAFILFAPFHNIYIMFIPIGIPAILFGIVYMGITYRLMMNSAYGQGQSRIGHEAHLAGSVAGLLITAIIAPDSVRSFLASFMNLLA